jgi:hypothetical protein
MHQALQNVVVQSGLWNGAQTRSHSFLLSPSVYTLTLAQKEELTELGYSLHSTLLGLSRMGVIAYNDHLNTGNAWRLIRNVFSSGVPKHYRAPQGSNPLHIPELLKVDLMVNEAGEFRIAEIDGHNKHGLGYSTLGRKMRNQIQPAGEALPGAVATLKKVMEKSGASRLNIFYADQERFYIPEFEIARQEFEQLGFECEVFSEMDARPDQLENGVFLDLPFLYHREELSQMLLTRYQNREVRFVIPPKPCLGAKGVLALLRNDVDNGHLEAILQAFIPAKDLQRVREYIPRTFLVGRQGLDPSKLAWKISEGRYVLKESISSGMKGTVFSDDPDFQSILERASKTQLNWILQEEVVNAPQTFSHFDQDATCHTSNDWFMRVTVQYVGRTLADVVVTARQDKAVHGAPDCIMLGTTVL